MQTKRPLDVMGLITGLTIYVMAGGLIVVLGIVIYTTYCAMTGDPWRPWDLF